MSDPLSKKILVVDDDPLITKALNQILETEGYAVSVASSGRAAIDAFQKALQDGAPFAVVITDLGMPGVDGRQVVNAVKALSPATPVILLTGWGQWFKEGTDASLPVNHVLAKPPGLAELRRALAECLPEKIV
ncbi:MAG TPA: response regulator [Verrucomicrobiae bacterium]|jgi:CheY-like chemotaxis protein|nr:response regulator [Verrucomicrobiae bacterium]